jgi:hypothetical protein
MQAVSEVFEKCYFNRKEAPVARYNEKAICGRWLTLQIGYMPEARLLPLERPIPQEVLAASRALLLHKIRPQEACLVAIATSPPRRSRIVCNGGFGNWGFLPKIMAARTLGPGTGHPHHRERRAILLQVFERGQQWRHSALSARERWQVTSNFPHHILRAI